MQTVDFRYFPLHCKERVLDLGCGEGRHVITAYMEEEVHAVGIDLSLSDLKITKQRFREFQDQSNKNKHLSIALANGMFLPFLDNSFDKVICSEVLEHVPDYRAVIAEANRVLKTGGILAVSVPRFGPEWICWRLSREYHEVPGGHIRIFNATGLRRDIEEFGLIHYKRHWAHALHVPYWWLKCLFWSDGVHENWLVAGYHKLLVWDLMKNPWITRNLEKMLDPIFGKSVIMYFVKGLQRPSNKKK